MPDALLQKERNRFVGFSFATAQLLLELDESNRIVYAAGASFQIAESANQLLGRPIDSIVAERDVGFLGHILQRYREGRPGQMVRVALKRDGKPAQDFLVGGCIVETTPGALYLGLVPALGVARALAGSASKLADAAAMQAAAEGDPSLTLYASRALAELSAADPDLTNRITQDIHAYLRSVSLGGEYVTDLAPGRYGFLRAAGVSDGEIEQSVATILTQADLEPAGQLFNIRFDSAELNSEDAARALAYTIEKFARSEPTEFTLRSVQEAVAEMIGNSVSLMQSARTVLTEGALEVAFQKVVEMRTGETHHFEALSRFSGIESVADFIRFMEDSGIVQDLDLLVVQKVFEQLVEMGQSGWRPKVAVNLSGRSIQGDIFRGRLLQLGQTHADLRSQMLFELTETSSITAIDSTAQFLNKLASCGHAICLDDVGAGSTSLQMLRAMPANFIKLDGSVVHGASRPGGDRTLFKALVDLARGKGAELIAEQIETEADARFCAQAGARFGQGWLFGKASPEAIKQRDKSKPIDIGGNWGGGHTLR
ncbi:EAL domain-containing protein [Roseiterribacter gracilis]|uniref:Diguanylate phosphodiesterase n=1 Tax=Roseiterribacter gracilis TaxID=2812848 RepID=A0A8S8XAA1_9PROT|nr:diguanylate phosphodiesterase [Rhodospirillales bacterium TMPK1]